MKNADGGMFAEKGMGRGNGRRGKWKSIKILRETDELLEKYSKTLGMSKYEFIDFVVTIFGMLLQDRIKMRRDKAKSLGLIECEAEYDAGYSYLYPWCIVYNLIESYLRKVHAYQTLLENLKQMHEYEKEKEVKAG